MIGRIAFLENALNVMLKEHQMTTLHLQARRTIDEAIRSRQRHKALAIMSKPPVRKKEKGSISASIQLNGSSESSKKLPEMKESQEEWNCNLD